MCQETSRAQIPFGPTPAAGRAQAGPNHSAARIGALWWRRPNQTERTDGQGDAMSWVNGNSEEEGLGALGAAVPDGVRTVEKALFREAMSRLGAAVHVVTTAGPGGRSAITATAVCSVSDDPPTVLLCVNRASRAAPVFGANRVFCVNTLGAEEDHVADVFAGRTRVEMDERFKTGSWTTLRTGSPVLRSAVMAFDCRAVEIKEVATHNIVFGVVEAIHMGERGPALVYHERIYKRV